MRALFRKETLIDLLENFVLFYANRAKIVAKNHQFQAWIFVHNDFCFPFVLPCYILHLSNAPHQPAHERHSENDV
jgi:hypothetical protein